MTGGNGIRVQAVPPTSALAHHAMRSYIRDVASRYYSRPATDAEIEAGLAQHPTDDMEPPHGFFLVATTDTDSTCGCVALARVDAAVGEVRRLHVDPATRRQGLGRRLMLDVEARARHMGLTALRLDTRNDLVESQRLYESLGYLEAPPHSGGPFSDRWYRKAII